MCKQYTVAPQLFLQEGVQYWMVTLQRQIKHTEQNRPNHALGFATQFLKLRSGNDVKLAKEKNWPYTTLIICQCQHNYKL